MAVVQLTISAATGRKIKRDQKLAARSGEIFAAALETAAVLGADDIRNQLVMGDLGLTMQHPASGMAAAMMGWMIDRNEPLAAMGIPGNSPAAAYAEMQRRADSDRSEPNDEKRKAKAPAGRRKARRKASANKVRKSSSAGTSGGPTPAGPARPR